MRAKKTYSDQKRAAAIAALLAGTTPAQVARNMKLPESTVRTWGKDAGVAFAEIRAEKKERVEDLIVAYLTENLRALQAHAKHSADKSWLQLQNAESLAILHGVMADKMIRILEAAASAEPLPGNKDAPEE